MRTSVSCNVRLLSVVTPRYVAPLDRKPLVVLIRSFKTGSLLIFFFLNNMFIIPSNSTMDTNSNANMLAGWIVGQN